MNIKNHTKTTLLAALVGLAISGTASAGKPVYVGKNIAAAQQVSMDKINHSTWDRLMKKYVDKNGMVNYRALKASASDMQVVDQYLGTLSTANPRGQASREGQLAFWINAYNAVTVKGILQKYPTTSIRNHTAKAIGYNIWKDLQLIVGGRPISLDDMEHKVLRKMNDPRIHFAIVCASIGCPRLLNEAYVPQKVKQQLDINAKDFFSRPQNFRHAGNQFQMSSIMDWFKGDFGANQTAQLNTISQWLPTAAAQNAARSGRVSISYLDYNWQLNEQAKAMAGSGSKAGSGAKAGSGSKVGAGR